MKSRKAFTLIELLVVISIIALLLSILVPAMNKARESARKVVCATNLRQIGLNLEFYCDDYTNCGLLGIIPYIFGSADAKTSPDVGRMDILWCPSGAQQYTDQSVGSWIGSAYATFGYTQYAGYKAATCAVGTNNGLLQKTWQALEHCPSKNIPHTGSGGKTSRSSWITVTDINFSGFSIRGSGATVKDFFPRSNHYARATVTQGRNTGASMDSCAGSNSLHVDCHVEWNSIGVMQNDDKLIHVFIDPALGLVDTMGASWWQFPRSN